MILSVVAGLFIFVILMSMLNSGAQFISDVQEGGRMQRQQANEKIETDENKRLFNGLCDIEKLKLLQFELEDMRLSNDNHDSFYTSWDYDSYYCSKYNSKIYYYNNEIKSL